MDCNGLDEKLYEFVSGGVDDAARAECDAHVGACARCQREVADYRKTVLLIEKTRNPMMPESFWDRQRARIMEAVHRVVAMRPWKAPPLSLSLMLVVVAAYILVGLDAICNGTHVTTRQVFDAFHFTLIPLYAFVLFLGLYSFRERKPVSK